MPYVFALAETATGYLASDTLTAFTNAFESIKIDVNSMVSAALPVGLGIMGLFLAIRLGIGFFRSIAN